MQGVWVKCFIEVLEHDSCPYPCVSLSLSLFRLFCILTNAKIKTKVIQVFFLVFSYICDLSLPYLFVNGATFVYWLKSMRKKKKKKLQRENRKRFLHDYRCVSCEFVKILTLNFILQIFKIYAHFLYHFCRWLFMMDACCCFVRICFSGFLD